MKELHPKIWGEARFDSVRSPRKNVRKIFTAVLLVRERLAQRHIDDLRYLGGEE
jgi:hypothetical protein